MSTGTPAPRSLRSRLLLHVIVPLAGTWLLGTMLALGVARYFTQHAFDRALLDDAYVVARHVRLGNEGGLTLGMTAAEIGTLLFDQNESIYFALYLQDGRLRAGHPGRKHPQDIESTSPRFSEIMFQNRALRAAVLERQQPLPYTVVVAQTTNSQDLLFQRLMFISLVPQAFLLIWLALWLRRVIQEDVQPLMDLEEAVARRDAYDLTPVAVSNRTRDVQRLTEVVNDLFLRVGQSVRTQREFVGNVAHELRTPLAGVRALVEYALSQSDPKVWQEQLRNIAQSQERASHLIDQLLALALAEEAEQALQPQQIALDEVVRDTLMRHLHRADTLGVDLGARGLEAPVWVLAQRALLEGVLDNLIDNALRYGLRDASQARHVTLEVAHDPRTERVVLSVQDNGPGITEEQRKRVLSRWGQGSAGEALKQGSGLGLAIVSEYARILGATLTLEAGDDGRGLKVSLTFADQFSVG